MIPIPELPHSSYIPTCEFHQEFTTRIGTAVAREYVSPNTSEESDECSEIWKVLSEGEKFIVKWKW